MAKAQTTVSYALSPPEGTGAPTSFAPTATHAFTVEADKSGSVKEYYEAVRQSIAAAREKAGEELTAWRDAVGNAEAPKERAAKAARAEEDEEDEEEQEQ